MEYDTEYEESSQSSQACSADAGRLEVASIMGEQFELPQGLAENADIFKEFFSVSTWQSLNSSERAYLQVNDIFSVAIFEELTAYLSQ